jgi:beta-N-acetylhexosaminidase
LRGALGFRGVVIGDDIGMAAAEQVGSIGARIEAHLLAGCDLLLACSPAIVDEAIAASAHAPPCADERLMVLQGEVAQTWDALTTNPQRDQFIARLEALDPDTTARS